ncbi:MAG TPA: SMC-Scp complex subunit ScpB [Elusimicrobiota bacterium]|nr:SMC-Scp complex subunit ScpB [Elusimicrobiota bacterium]
MSSPEADPAGETPEQLAAIGEDAAAQSPAEPEVVEAEDAVEAADQAGVSAAPSVPSPANDDDLLRRALEALLFITDRPLSAAELGKLVGIRDQDKIIGTVEELRRDLEAKNAGYRLIAVAEGWQMATRPELAPYVRKLFADRATMRLSTAAQETLSIIAYRQPLTRAEIEEIRGVEVIAALETLLEKGLTKVVGRKETVGRPLMYGTTSEFLRHFGLRSLEDLPPLDAFTPAEDVPPAAAPADAAAAPEPAVPAPEFSAQTEEAVVAEALSEHPGSEPAPEVEAAAETPAEPEGGSEESDEGSIWPK